MAELIAKPRVPLQGTTLHVEMKIVPTWQYRVRLRLGIWLVLLAGKALGCAVEVDTELYVPRNTTGGKA